MRHTHDLLRCRSRQAGNRNVIHCLPPPSSSSFQVRVGNLQELVYKQGQAGVTKATVTINFNNADKKGSPVGYEHFDQISVTRQVRSQSFLQTRS